MIPFDNANLVCFCLIEKTSVLYSTDILHEIPIGGIGLMRITISLFGYCKNIHQKRSSTLSSSYRPNIFIHLFLEDTSTRKHGCPA
jgi:hypothetical protein